MARQVQTLTMFHLVQLTAQLMSTTLVWYMTQIRNLTTSTRHTTPLVVKTPINVATATLNQLHTAGCPLQSISLTLVTFNTRGNQRKLLHQWPSSSVHAGLFCCRAPREWKDIPIDTNIRFKNNCTLT
jgi:hypothetical protein